MPRVAVITVFAGQKDHRYRIDIVAQLPIKLNYKRRLGQRGNNKKR